MIVRGFLHLSLGVFFCSKIYILQYECKLHSIVAALHSI